MFEVGLLDNVGKKPRLWYVQTESFEKAFEHATKLMMPAIKRTWNEPREWVSVNVRQVPGQKAREILGSRESCTQPDAN